MPKIDFKRHNFYFMYHIKMSNNPHNNYHRFLELRDEFQKMFRQMGLINEKKMNEYEKTTPDAYLEVCIYHYGTMRYYTLTKLVSPDIRNYLIEFE